MMHSHIVNERIENIGKFNIFNSYLLCKLEKYIVMKKIDFTFFVVNIFRPAKGLARPLESLVG